MRIVWDKTCTEIVSLYRTGIAGVFAALAYTCNTYCTQDMEIVQVLRPTRQNQVEDSTKYPLILLVMSKFVVLAELGSYK